MCESGDTLKLVDTVAYNAIEPLVPVNLQTTEHRMSFYTGVNLHTQYFVSVIYVRMYVCYLMFVAKENGQLQSIAFV